MGQGTQAAARVLDELEDKGAEAGDEDGNPAQFQQQYTPSESGAEAAIESDAHLRILLRNRQGGHEHVDETK